MRALSMFDVVVIGGGGSGYAAASTAARLGAGVAMVEGGKLGGTCLNEGCVPTKTLLRSAQVYDTVRRAAEFGVNVEGAKLDFQAVMRRKRAIIEGMSGEGPIESLSSQGIELIRGYASFRDRHSIEVDGSQIHADAFVIATGSKPVIPPVPGLSDAPYLTSRDALDLEELPPSLLIVGGGVVGCEFASIFNAFGSRVSIVSRRLLSAEDPDVGDTLAQSFRERGIELLLGGRLAALRSVGGKPVAVIRYDEGSSEDREFHQVLLAVGRTARYDGLALDSIGVETDDRGIVVDGRMRTSVPNIWAAGDVTGRHMYTHAGDLMGEVAGWNAAGGTPAREAELDVVPRPVYSIPAVAAIGLTEAEAEQQGCDVETVKVRFSDITRAIINGNTEGWCKLLTDCSDGRILGASMVGVQVDELIGEVAIAMQGGISAWTLGDTLHPYPTLSEIVRWTADQAGPAPEAVVPAREQPFGEAVAEVEFYKAGALAATSPPQPEGYGGEEDCVESVVAR